MELNLQNLKTQCKYCPSTNAWQTINVIHFHSPPTELQGSWVYTAAHQRSALPHRMEAAGNQYRGLHQSIDWWRHYVCRNTLSNWYKYRVLFLNLLLVKLIKMETCIAITECGSLLCVVLCLLLNYNKFWSLFFCVMKNWIFWIFHSFVKLFFGNNIDTWMLILTILHHQCMRAKVVNKSVTLNKCIYSMSL